MNFDAVAAFVLATPMWIGVFAPLLTGKTSFTDDIDSRGSTSFGRKRRRRIIRTYTRKRHLKEFRGYVMVYLVFAVLFSGYGIWALVTDSHLIFD